MLGLLPCCLRLAHLAEYHPKTGRSSLGAQTGLFPEPSFYHLATLPLAGHSYIHKNQEEAVQHKNKQKSKMGANVSASFELNKILPASKFAEGKREKATTTCVE